MFPTLYREGVGKERFEISVNDNILCKKEPTDSAQFRRRADLRPVPSKSRSETRKNRKGLPIAVLSPFLLFLPFVTALHHFVSRCTALVCKLQLGAKRDVRSSLPDHAASTPFGSTRRIRHRPDALHSVRSRCPSKRPIPSLCV